MRLKPTALRIVPSDALELASHLFLFSLIAFVVWAWGLVGAPWEVKGLGYLAAGCGLVGLGFLWIAQDIRLFRVIRTQWRRTFPRRRR